MFVGADRARDVAAEQIRGGPAAGDPVFRAWRGAGAGRPVLVHDDAGRPSYWLVPVVAAGDTVGLVRVLGDGRASASTALRAAAAITSITASEARRQCRSQIDRKRGERCGAVLLVHDGPPGREAWRVEVVGGGRPLRWIFVTAGGTYARPAGETRDDVTQE